MATHRFIGTSAGIAVRAFDLADMESYREWLDPEQEWHSWDGPYFPKSDAAEVDARVARFARTVASGEYSAQSPLARAVVTLEERPDVLVGSVSWHWESEESDWRRMGLTVYEPRVRGRGIGTEALRIWTDYLFATTDVVRLDFSTWSGNTRMIGVGHRLSFAEEARFREAREVRGKRYDSVVMGILRRDWTASPHHAALA